MKTFNNKKIIITKKSIIELNEFLNDLFEFILKNSLTLKKFEELTNIKNKHSLKILKNIYLFIYFIIMYNNKSLSKELKKYFSMFPKKLNNKIPSIEFISN